MMVDYRILIKKILVENCEVEASLIKDSSDFQADLGLDSVGLLTLITELENQLGYAFEFSLDEAPKTVEEVSLFLEKRQQ